VGVTDVRIVAPPELLHPDLAEQARLDTGVAG